MLGTSETFSKSLQGKDTAIQEAITAAHLAKGFCIRQRTDQAFELFYTDVLDTARIHEVGDPQLPRHRRAPRRFDSRSQPHLYISSKEYSKPREGVAHSAHKTRTRSSHSCKELLILHFIASSEQNVHRGLLPIYKSREFCGFLTHA